MQNPKESNIDTELMSEIVQFLEGIISRRTVDLPLAERARIVASLYNDVYAAESEPITVISETKLNEMRGHYNATHDALVKLMQYGCYGAEEKMLFRQVKDNLRWMGLILDQEIQAP